LPVSTCNFTDSSSRTLFYQRNPANHCIRNQRNSRDPIDIVHHCIMNRIARPALRQTPLLRGCPTRCASTVRSKPPAPPASSDWPWRSIGRNSKTGEIVQERTIYARPLNFRPRLLWLVMGEFRTTYLGKLNSL
jgi:hypothetical protein